MRQILMTTAAVLAFAGVAQAQVSVGTNTGVNVGNGASTVRVDGNSTIRTMGDGTTTITRPTNEAFDNTRLGTQVRNPATSNPRDVRVKNSVDTNSGVKANTRIQTTSPKRVYDPATGITNSVSGTASGAMGSVADTIKGPLGGGASATSTTSGSVGN